MKTNISILLTILAVFFIDKTQLIHEAAWQFKIVIGLFVYLFINLILSLTNKE